MGAGELAGQLKDLELVVHATAGTAAFLARFGVEARPVAKLGESNGTVRQDAIALLRREKVGLVLNTPAGGRGRSDAASIRMAAQSMGVACITTLEGALAALEGIRALRSGSLDVRPL